MIAIDVVMYIYKVIIIHVLRKWCPLDSRDMNYDISNVIIMIWKIESNRSMQSDKNR